MPLERTHSPRSLRLRAGLLLPVLTLTLAVRPAAATAQASSAPATAVTETSLAEDFDQQVRPFLRTYCLDCHSGPDPEASFDLSGYTSVGAVVRDFEHWDYVHEMLDYGYMPPDDAERQPPTAERQSVMAWIEQVLHHASAQDAGDPGIVLVRRLSNAEYDHTIRDLTGVDLRPRRELPADPTNMAGFDNSGETLVMSATLLTKHFQAARAVADHLYLGPDGIGFAPHPMISDTDREKFAIQRIIAFYGRFNLKLEDTLAAAWHHRWRERLGQPAATLADIAAARGVSTPYLNTVWQVLHTPNPVGPIATLQARWLAWPEPTATGAEPPALAPAAHDLADWITRTRAKVENRFLNIDGGEIESHRHPMIMWRNHQYASHRRDFDATQLQFDGVRQPRPDTSAEPGREVSWGPGQTPQIINAPGDPDLFVPTGDRAAHLAAWITFCATFPDRFLMAERGRRYFDTSIDRGRYLSAGIHNQMGYFRDDQPLYELILTDSERAELDRLWREFDFIANHSARTFREISKEPPRQFVSAAAGGTLDPAAADLDDRELDPLRWPNSAWIQHVAAVFRQRAASGEPAATAAVDRFFGELDRAIRWVESAHHDAEPRQLDDLIDLARRAYRRPLTPADTAELTDFYHAARATRLSHEEALRETLVFVLMYPDLNVRLDLAADAPGVQPLTSLDLASRLSYFLWSSLPDERLMDLAIADRLTDPAVLVAEARRMLHDPRARALAVEFGTRWLDIRDFSAIATVDRDRFPAFDDELRDAMFEEPVHLLLDVMQHDRPITDLLYGPDTFVNETLARHYDIPWDPTPADPAAGGWRHVNRADRYGRGGLLPMAVFLTKHAPGLRTSPVKRGNWVVKNILGERVPAPPAVVPDLPGNEAELDLPLRDMLARHRADPACASCHERFDSYGLVFENYGPIGQRRTTDLAGRPVQVDATFPDGTDHLGFDGLKAHIAREREQDFIDNFCGKLLAFALGRSLILSDNLLLHDLREKLAAQGHRFDVVLEAIVTSPQFLHKRGPDPVAADAAAKPEN